MKEHRCNMLLTDAASYWQAVVSWLQTTAKLPPSHPLTSPTQQDGEITLDHLSSPLSQGQFHSFSPNSSTLTLSSTEGNEAVSHRRCHCSLIPAKILIPTPNIQANSQSGKLSPCSSSSQGCHRSPLCSMLWGDTRHHEANFPNFLLQRCPMCYNTII